MKYFKKITIILLTLVFVIPTWSLANKTFDIEQDILNAKKEFTLLKEKINNKVLSKKEAEIKWANIIFSLRWKKNILLTEKTNYLITKVSEIHNKSPQESEKLLKTLKVTKESVLKLIDKNIELKKGFLAGKISFKDIRNSRKTNSIIATKKISQPKKTISIAPEIKQSIAKKVLETTAPKKTEEVVIPTIAKSQLYNIYLGVLHKNKEHIKIRANLKQLSDDLKDISNRKEIKNIINERDASLKIQKEMNGKALQLAQNSMYGTGGFRYQSSAATDYIKAQEDANKVKINKIKKKYQNKIDWEKQFLIDGIVKWKDIYYKQIKNIETDIMDSVVYEYTIIRGYKLTN